MKSQKKKKSTEKEEKSPQKTVDKSIKSNGFADTFELLKNSVKPILISFGKFVSHIRINPLNFSLIMAGKDAAELAIDYGRLCAVFYPSFAELCEIMKIGRKNIYIGVDYVKDNYEINLDMTVKIKLCFVLALVFKVLYTILKDRIKQMMKNNKVNQERNVAK